jgi:hypothetical protein
MTKAQRTAMARKAGMARSQALTPEARRAIAKKAIAARWAKAKKV